MNKNSKYKQSYEKLPGWTIYTLPFIAALLGAIVVWAVWSFYKDILNTSNFHWYNWIQPVLMAIGSLMCFVAAGLLAFRKHEGLEMLYAAFYLAPVILALRLMIVILRFIWFAVHWMFSNSGSIMDGSFIRGLTIKPINIIILVAVIILAILNKADKSHKAPKENEDE